MIYAGLQPVCPGFGVARFLLRQVLSCGILFEIERTHIAIQKNHGGFPP